MLTKIFRYRDLHAAGILTSRVDQKNKIEKHGFPEGRRAPGSNNVYWLAHEVNAWLEAQPRASETKPAQRRRQEARCG